MEGLCPPWHHLEGEVCPPPLAWLCFISSSISSEAKSHLDLWLSLQCTLLQPEELHLKVSNNSTESPGVESMLNWFETFCILTCTCQSFNFFRWNTLLLHEISLDLKRSLSINKSLIICKEALWNTLQFWRILLVLIRIWSIFLTTPLTLLY